MSEKRFDFEDEYITLDGGVFATAKDRQDAELISRTLNQLYDESKELLRDNEQLRFDFKEMKGLLHSLEKENKELKYENINIMSDLDYYRAKSGSCEEGLFQQDREIAKLEKENRELKGLIDLFAQDTCDLTELLYKNNIDYKLHSDVTNFIVKWGIRID